MTSPPARELGASKAAIRHHYDVSDAFYTLWLDATRSYSCALWDAADPSDSLERAQLRKLDDHAAAARAAGTARVLDIGCGWGGLLSRLVNHHGVGQGIGITTSDAHAAWVRSLGDPRISARVESYLEHVPESPYDAIVSVEAFEAFARPELTAAERAAAYRGFFTKCHEWLKPSGSLSLQTIAYGNLPRGKTAPFIVGQVFPESDLPTLGDIADAAQGLFEVELVRNHREDYERTCATWLRQLRAERARATELVGADVVKRYVDYLHHSRVGFALGALCLYRLTLRRIDQPRG